MSETETLEFVNRRTLENAYREAQRAQQNRRESVASAGMRAAKARDSRLLKVLEKGAEILHQMSVEQWSPNGTMEFSGGVRSAPTEANLWREAYKTADAGEPHGTYAWIYGAAAILCGYV